MQTVIPCEYVQKPNQSSFLVGSEAKNPLPTSNVYMKNTGDEIISQIMVSAKANISFMRMMIKIVNETRSLVCHSNVKNNTEILNILDDADKEIFYNMKEFLADYTYQTKRRCVQK